jgi:tripartite-type tricarboxylate transporter receptor subunit TctC
MRAAPRLLASALAFVATAAAAQGALEVALDGERKPYPSRAIRMIVPFPPGGPADIIARFVGQRMSEDFGQPVVIENRAGGNTAIGAQAAARSAPDGYTLFVPMDTTMVMNPLVMPNLPYDPLKDFAPITLLTKNMSLVVVRSDGPKTVKELIAKAKANPGKLNMGAGTITSRLGALLFTKSAGIDVQLIPYKGSAEIVQGVLSGSVEFALDSVGSSLPMIQSGQFRALAKYSNRPLPQLPDVPSLSKAAELPEIDESATWIGLLAPAGTPNAVLDKVSAEVERIFADPAMLERMQKAGLFPVSSKPAEFDAFIRSETERWSKVIQDNKGLRLE